MGNAVRNDRSRVVVRGDIGRYGPTDNKWAWPSGRLKEVADAVDTSEVISTSDEPPAETSL